MNIQYGPMQILCLCLNNVVPLKILVMSVFHRGFSGTGYVNAKEAPFCEKISHSASPCSSTSQPRIVETQLLATIFILSCIHSIRAHAIKIFIHCYRTWQLFVQHVDCTLVHEYYSGMDRGIGMEGLAIMKTSSCLVARMSTLYVSTLMVLLYSRKRAPTDLAPSKYMDYTENRAKQM